MHGWFQLQVSHRLQVELRTFRIFCTQLDAKALQGLPKPGPLWQAHTQQPHSVRGPRFKRPPAPLHVRDGDVQHSGLSVLGCACGVSRRRGCWGALAGGCSG